MYEKHLAWCLAVVIIKMQMFLEKAISSQGNI